jgi:hypothetical protein
MLLSLSLSLSLSPSLSPSLSLSLSLSLPIGIIFMILIYMIFTTRDKKIKTRAVTRLCDRQAFVIAHFVQHFRKRTLSHCFTMDYSREMKAFSVFFPKPKELRSFSGVVLLVSIEAPLILGNAINYI